MDKNIEIIEFKNPTIERLRITKIKWHFVQVFDDFLETCMDKKRIWGMMGSIS